MPGIRNWKRQVKASANHFLTYETVLVLLLAVLENSVLPMALDSSQATLKLTTTKFQGDVTYAPPCKALNNVRRRSLRDIKCHK